MGTARQRILPILRECLSVAKKLGPSEGLPWDLARALSLSLFLSPLSFSPLPPFTLEAVTPTSKRAVLPEVKDAASPFRLGTLRSQLSLQHTLLKLAPSSLSQDSRRISLQGSIREGVWEISSLMLTHFSSP